MTENKVGNKKKSEKGKVTGPRKIGHRTLIAFWILGLCNNYGYVVMLSAAHDILSDKHNGDSGEVPEVHRNSSVRDCNQLSTGAILLADIMPSLVIKLTAPFFPLLIHFRMVLVIFLSCAGYILVASSKAHWVAILGVVSTAFSSGLGETSLLSYMSFYKNKNVIVMWSSGTGGAGFFGAFTYAAMTNLLHLTPSTSIYILLAIPALMAISFWLLLKSPTSFSSDGSNETGEEVNPVGPSANATEDNSNDCDALPLTTPAQTFMEKLKYIPSLFKYMIPLGLVYLFEYFINQGLFELIKFDLSWLDHSGQYRWYQVLYQIGVFVSRSSINLFTIRRTWILAILQGLNIILFATEAVYSYLPTIFIVMAFVLWEGVLGGASYVNTYHIILNEVPPERREFSMAITSLADAIGISIAGFAAMPVHNFICGLPRYDI